MNLLYGVLLFIIAHIGAFFQLNGQFKWDFFTVPSYRFFQDIEGALNF